MRRPVTASKGGSMDDQDDITFSVGDPELNLHLPLESSEGATSNQPTNMFKN